MSLLFESIKVVHNSLQNLDYHTDRVNRSRKQLLGTNEAWNLKKLIELPKLDPNLVYKCRFIYWKEVVSIEFHPYTLKPLKTLKLVECPDMEYSLKYFDRNKFEALKAANSEADDIVIVQHNRITDCSYANIVFYNGEKWITPSTPLLKGTKWQMYIDNHIISEQEVTIFNLKLFTKARIINAMIDLDECPDIFIENIV